MRFHIQHYVFLYFSYECYFHLFHPFVFICNVFLFFNVLSSRSNSFFLFVFRYNSFRANFSSDIEFFFELLYQQYIYSFFIGIAISVFVFRFNITVSTCFWYDKSLFRSFFFYFAYAFCFAVVDRVAECIDFFHFTSVLSYTALVIVEPTTFSFEENFAQLMLLLCGKISI